MPTVEIISIGTHCGSGYGGLGLSLPLSSPFRKVLTPGPSPDGMEDRDESWGPYVPASKNVQAETSMDYRKDSVNWFSLVFGTGRGGAGFDPSGPALTRSRGGYYSGNPRPAPVRGPPILIPGTGPRLLPPSVKGTCLGYEWGGGLNGDSGRECRKRHPAPGR